MQILYRGAFFIYGSDNRYGSVYNDFVDRPAFTPIVMGCFFYFFGKFFGISQTMLQVRCRIHPVRVVIRIGSEGLAPDIDFKDCFSRIVALAKLRRVIRTNKDID